VGNFEVGLEFDFEFEFDFDFVGFGFVELFDFADFVGFVDFVDGVDFDLLDNEYLDDLYLNFDLEADSFHDE